MLDRTEMIIHQSCFTGSSLGLIGPFGIRIISPFSHLTFTADMAVYIPVYERKHIIRHLLGTSFQYVFIFAAAKMLLVGHPFLRHLQNSAIFFIIDLNVWRFRNCALTSNSSASSWARIELMYISSDVCIDRSTLSWLIEGPPRLSSE